jgi:hypothetical protein
MDNHSTIRFFDMDPCRWRGKLGLLRSAMDYRRVTKRDLTTAVEYLNTLSGGDYSLSGAYGDWQMVENNGSSSVTRGGHTTKKECLLQIDLFTQGYRESIWRQHLASCEQEFEPEQWGSHLLCDILTGQARGLHRGRGWAWDLSIGEHAPRW